jgi:putative transcriptional regulator
MKKTAKSKPKARLSPGEELGLKLLKSVKEMTAGTKARATKVTPNPVAAARLKTGLSQAQFAKVLHISARTLQEWEQGRRQPSGAAQALIQIANRHPEVIAEALG